MGILEKLNLGGFPNAHITSIFIFDEKKYEIDYFKIFFSQEVDYKGQPQHETRGGQLKIKLTQIPDNNLYTWAKTSTLKKNGEIIFQTDLGISVLRVSLENAYCVELTRITDSMQGAHTILVISPENIKLNSTIHNNRW